MQYEIDTFFNSAMKNATKVIVEPKFVYKKNSIKSMNWWKT